MNNDLNPNMNKNKQNDIVELWYMLTGEKFGKVNLASNDDFRSAIPAGTREYINAIKKNEIDIVASQDIEIKGDKNLHLTFLHDFNLYDMENPQKGVEDKTSFKAIGQALQMKDPKDKSVAILDGDIIGKEYTISKLSDAVMNNNYIEFWGVQKRVDKLIDYLAYLAERGPDEIILMNGRDEHLIKNKLNRDVLNDALLDKFNKIVLHYAVETAKKTLGKKAPKDVKISYVPGVKKVFNIKRISGNKITYYDFSVHTNLKTTCETLKGVAKAAEKQHAGLAEADVKFVSSENAVGEYGGVVYTSGLARNKDASRGNLAAPSPKGYNTFTLLLGDQSHDVELIRTPIFTNPTTHALEKKVAKEDMIRDYLVETCERLANESLKNYYGNKNSTVNYRQMIIDKKVQENKNANNIEGGKG